jgi:hypothetical protein
MFARKNHTKKNIIMKRNKILAWAFAIASICALAACSDDNEALLRPAVDIESTQTTVSSLTFWWPDRGDAVSWHYVFKNESGEVLSEADLPVDHSRRLVFTGLKSDTKYTLEVTAIDADGNTSTTSFTAKTAAVTQLTTPSPEFSQTGVVVTLSWQAITNATSYTYQIVDAENQVVKEGSTTDLSLEYDDLAIGDYTLNVVANAGEEAYSDSQTATLSFTRALGRLVTSPGVYTTVDGTVYRPALIYMEDDSYIIENFHGVAGYDLCFTVDSNNRVVITNGEENAPLCVDVRTGNGDEYVRYRNTSKFSGDEFQGSISFVTFAGTETYTWEALVIPSFEVTLYADVYMSGYSSDYSDYFDIPAEMRNGVITINNFLGSSQTVKIAYDKEAETASCDLNVGWNTGWYYIGNFPKLMYIYYYSTAYCYYDAEYDAICIDFYAYTDSTTKYWSTLYIYLDEVDD